MAAKIAGQGCGLSRELRGNVLWLAFDRPEASNAINPALAQAFYAELERTSRDDSVAAVVMTGNGNKVFSAGIDIKNPENLDHEGLSAYRRNAVSTCLAAIVDFEKPLIAAVNGPAIGLGCMLAMLADRVIVSDKATFSLPEIKIGIPTFLGISILTRAVGGSISRDLVLTGRRMTALEACQHGLAAVVATAESFFGAAQSAAEELAAKPKITFALNKRWLARGLREELAAANEESKAVQVLLAAEKQTSSN